MNRVKSLSVFSPFVIIVFTSIIGGGYFCYTSALLVVICGVYVLYFILRKKKFILACDLNLFSVLVLTSAYFIVSGWAVDSGMAFMGGMKFLPILLYFFILCQYEDEKEKIINMLPILGSVMTIFSFVMMKFPVFSNVVTVAGRLAGFFQYPNTYAVFMLVCMIIAIYKSVVSEKVDWMYVVHTIVTLFGIYLSGSRTVFVLMLLTLIIISFRKKNLRKVLFACVCIASFLALFIVVFKMGAEGVANLFNITIKSSSFLGRILYVRDAISLIIKHPFGIGYYGYYFLQQGVQTGLYSVVNVHNELIQIMLDIGILPGLLFYGAIIKSLVSRTLGMRNRLVLLVLFLHSLFDYDFQFMSICFVLLLFLELHNLKQINVSIVFRGFMSILVTLAVLISLSVGLSDFFYTINKTKLAIKCYPYNTMAKISLLGESESIQETSKVAHEILKCNKDVAIAYSAEARVAFSEGDVEKFIKYKLTALKMAPYQFEEYLDYLDTLIFCVEKYIKAGDLASAKSCVERAEMVPEMLMDLKRNTSELGWEIDDQPKVTLPKAYIDSIKEMREKVDE